MMQMHHPVDPTTLACASTTLRSAARAVSRGYDAAMAGDDLTVNQFAILRRIARAGELPLSRLAERLVMDRTTLYRALEPMTRAGWVAIEPAPSGRARIVRLTRDGERRMAAGTPAWEAAQIRLIEAFGIERWEALHAELRDLTFLADGLAAAPDGARP
jgi:DNA-binding MarR family transcriptional regulator